MYSNDLNYYGNPRPEMVKFLPKKSKRILDVGCGVGAFGKALKQLDSELEVWGTDISQPAIRVAQKNLDKAFCVTSDSKLDFLPQKFFDAVFFNDVLEHLVDPYSHLEVFKEKLTPNGVVIASIPNLRFFRVLFELLFKKDFRYQDDGVMDRTHLRFFTKKSMERMFRNAGFEILQIQPLNKSKSFRPWLLFVLSFGLLGKDIFFPQFGVVAKVGKDYK